MIFWMKFISYNLSLLLVGLFIGLMVNNSLRERCEARAESLSTMLKHETFETDGHYYVDTTGVSGNADGHQVETKERWAYDGNGKWTLVWVSRYGH